MHFSKFCAKSPIIIGNKVIERVSIYKILGVHVDCDLNGILMWNIFVRKQVRDFSINTQVIIQNRALSLARYLGLSADNHLDGQNGCQ